MMRDQRLRQIQFLNDGGNRFPVAADEKQYPQAVAVGQTLGQEGGALNMIIIQLASNRESIVSYCRVFVHVVIK